MSSYAVPTSFGKLSDKDVNLLFSTQSWDSRTMSPEARVEACQELENHLAEKDGAIARTVITQNMNGPTFGYQSGSFIVLNSNVIEDGVFRTSSEDKDGNQHIKELPVQAANFQVYDTVCHEHEHGLDLDKGNAQTVSYIDPESDYDLYRIQSSERNAFTAAEARTKAALAAIQQVTGKEDPNQQAYLDAVARESYDEALARAIAHYQDKDIQAVVDRVCADYEKGERHDYQWRSEQIVSQILDTQMQAAQEKGAVNTMDANVQEVAQDQTSLLGWEADLAAMNEEANDGEALQEDQGESEDLSQDYDDGMEM